MEKTLKGIVQYARKNYFSYWVVLGIDTALSVLCSLVAYAVIHYMAHVPMTDWMLCKFACVSLVSSVAGALLFHTYRNTIRFHKLVNFGVSCVPFYSKLSVWPLFLLGLYMRFNCHTIIKYPIFYLMAY